LGEAQDQDTAVAAVITAMVPMPTRNNPRPMSVRIARVFLRIIVIPSLNACERFSVVLCILSAEELFGYNERDKFS